MDRTDAKAQLTDILEVALREARELALLDDRRLDRVLDAMDEVRTEIVAVLPALEERDASPV